MHTLLLLLFALLSCNAQVRPLRSEELPQSLRGQSLAAINAATAQRMRDGEWDHLIFYALQSASFTSHPAVEPARSAKTWKESGRIPADAAKRLQAFFLAPPNGERHRQMRRMVRNVAELHNEYQRAMEFLYEKEWASRTRQGVDRREFIASLYQTRGHSTDTEVRATYGVHVGLSVLKQMHPERRIRRVLLIGPGLDWAPRTGLRDDTPPASYQPYALMDSLLRLGLSQSAELTIDCADVNPRVVDHINAFPATPRRLHLLYAPGDSDWNAYFEQLGAAAGKREGTQFIVQPQAASRVRAMRMNVLTERVVDAASYDLAVATNILLYFDDKELGLALANIARALRGGGHLLHNDLRSAIDPWGRQLQLPPIHARTVRIDATRELYDGVVLHERGN